VGIARLDRVGQRTHGGHVRRAQLRGARALRLERLAQVRRVALELALLLRKPRNEVRLHDAAAYPPCRSCRTVAHASSSRTGSASRRATPCAGSPAEKTSTLRRSRRPRRSSAASAFS